VAQSSVDLIVNAVKAINPLRAVAAASKKAEVAINSLKRAAKDTGDKLADMGRRGKKGLADLAKRATQAAGRFGKLGKAAALAAAAAGAAAFLKFSFGKAGELERQTKSLQVLTGSLETAKGIISELQAFGAVTPFTSTELIETSKRLKAFGFETEQVVDITKRLADVAGATGADLSGIATAFGQIQAKGRLQGEELLQLQERGVALQDELRKMYGLTGTEFSKALEKGQISAKAAEVALIRLTEAGGKYANGAVAQSDTLFGKLSTLQDAFQRFGQNIGKVLSPIFKGIIGFLTTITNQINNLFVEAEIARKVDEQLGLGGQGAKKEFRSGSVADRRALLARREKLIEEERKKRAAQTTATTPDLTIPELLKGTAGTGQTDAERITEQLEKQVVALKEAKLLAAGKTSEDKAQIQLGIDLANLEDLRTEENTKLVDKVKEGVQALYDQEVATAANIKADKERADAKAKADEAEKKRLEQIRGIYQGISDTIADGVVDSLKAAIDGTKSFAEVVTSVFTDLQNQILQLIRNQIFFGNLTGTLTKGSGILGGLFGGFLANGGPAQAGRAYMVGERGPEMFVPRSSGTVIPNNQLGGGGANVVVNVDASGSSVQGDEGQSRQLGALIGAAVQTEIIKQQRPGGLLSR
jgi:tape measure domain-containing protein